MIFGIFTGALLLIFVFISLWAYSGRRRADFEDAARLPLQEDAQKERSP
ncbi:MAG: cbb3-type cytochrome c oxidase subunit 3 [Rudaea sp.]